MKKLILFICVFSTSVVLAESLEALDDRFSPLDTNHDGNISAEEAGNDPELSKNWALIDNDNNGVVDAAEFSSFEGREGVIEDFAEFSRLPNSADEIPIKMPEPIDSGGMGSDTTDK